MAIWTPEYIDTALWLDAADSSTITESAGAVSAWADKSGNARDAVQLNAAYQPILDGGGIFQNSPIAFKSLTISPSVSGLRSVALVSKWAAVDNNYRHVLDSSGDWHGDNSAKLLTGSYGSKYVYNGLGWKDGTSTAPSSMDCYTDQTIHMFLPTTIVSISGTGGGTGFPDRCFYGHHYELIASTEIWADSTRQKIEGYLAHKWGLEANLPAAHPYKSAAPQVLSISGTITGADGNPAARIVRVYSRSTGALLQEATSDAGGNYEFGFLTPDEVQRVVIADEGATVYNHIIDRVILG